MCEILSPNIRFWYFFGGPLSPLAVCANKLWPVSIVCKISGGRHIVSRKSRFGWVQTHMLYFMDSGPKFTEHVWLNAAGIVRDHISFRFLISCLIPEIFDIKIGSCVKLRQILHVLASKLVGGKRFELLALPCKTHPDTDHTAKFHGDRPSELGDPVSN